MFKKEELIYFALAIIVLGYVINYSAFTWIGWLQGMGLALAMIAIQIAAQNLMAYRFGAKLEYNLWDIRRYWFYEKAYFKKPFPAWLVIPILLIVITFGFVKWLAVLTFEAFPTTKRVKERWYELTEWEYALIAVSGIFANLILAIISEIAGWHEFAVLNLLFAFFNVLPFSELNGTKILFGSRMLWIFSIILIVTMLILIVIANIVATIIAALALAVITLVIYYMHYEQ
jgi:hypothetical protein